MTLEQYWMLFVKQWRLLVICLIIAGLGSYLGSKLIAPVYQATSLIQVSIRQGSNQADYTNLLASDQLVQTEAQLATSDPVLREVASHYPGMTVMSLSKQVTAVPKLNTQLFQINALSTNPVMAAQIANDVTATLIKQQLQATQQSNAQAQQQLQEDLVSTRQQIDTLNAQIADAQAHPGHGTQLALAQAELSGLQQHYSQWEAALAQLELAQSENGNFLLIVQAAQPPTEVLYPNVLINTLAGLLIGLFLGVLLAILFERLDVRVRTAEALTEILGVPILATVWQANTKDNVHIVNPREHDVNIESYRILRTNVGFANVNKALRFLMVTSAMPRDGKSVITANLAIFMAKAGKNVLLVDADLRRPTQHEKFGLNADLPGLSNAVLAFSTPSAEDTPTEDTSTEGQEAASETDTVSTVNLDTFIHPTKFPNLRLMPAGLLPPNPPELLDSRAMQRIFIEIASRGIDTVLFDVPPLLGLADASILASKVDGTLLVVDNTRANRESLKQVKALLQQAGTHVIGYVMNKQYLKRRDRSYSYYYSPKEQPTGKKQGIQNVESAPSAQ